MPLEVKPQGSGTTLNAVPEQVTSSSTGSINPTALQAKGEARPSLASLLKSSNQDEESKMAKVEQQPVSTLGNWQQVAPALIDDLKVIYPQLQMENDLLNLNGELTWQIQNDAPLNVSPNYLVSNSPELLNSQERRQVSHWLTQSLTP